MLTLVLLQYATFVVVISILGMFIGLVAILHHRHKLYEHIPGPKLSSFFTGNIKDLQPVMEQKQAFVELMFQLQVQYGPVMRFFFIHRCFVFAVDPPTVKELLMNSVHTKPDTYDLLFHLFGERFLGKGLVTEADHSKWTIHRKMFNPAFHRKYLKGLAHYFNESSDKLVECLMKDADTGKSVELMDGLSRVTLDIIAKAGFGMTQELILEDNPFNDAIEIVFAGMLKKFLNPYLWMNPKKWPYMHKVRSSLKMLRKTGKDIITQRLQMKVNGEELPDDILSYIIKYSDVEEGYEVEAMIDEFVTFFVAGQETTSNLLGFTLVEMGKRPDIMKRVIEEIDSVAGDKDYITFDDTLKMEYTLLVLKETLRLYPPATGTSRIAAFDMDICGYHIPAGTNVQLSHFIMCRMPQFFKDPLVFDPERFLRNDDKPLYAYFPFSLGPRSCIGQQFALVEARIILTKLFKKFTFKLDPNQSFAILDQLTLKPKGRCKNFIYMRDYDQDEAISAN